MTRFGWYTFLFIALLVASQFWLLWRTRNQRGRAAPRLDDVLAPRHLDQPRLILYFWRPGCHVCGPTSMVINPLLDKRNDIVKINALEERELVRRLGVIGTPTLVVISEGRIERMLTGSRNEQQIRDLVGAWDTDDDDRDQGVPM